MRLNFELFLWYDCFSEIMDGNYRAGTGNRRSGAVIHLSAVGIIAIPCIYLGAFVFIKLDDAADWMNQKRTKEEGRGIFWERKK